MHPEMERIQNCLAAVRRHTDFVPEVAVVLGSGLGGFADMVKQTAVVPYSEIPGFPVSTAPGHAGRFVFGYVEETPVVVMQGRVHLYEGYTPHDVVLPVRLMKAMGAKILFVTNASGGIRGDLTAGTLMSITDHISALIPNPLIGANIDELGVRFPDMSNAYDKGLRAILRETAKKDGIDLKEGVYIQFTGPSYESPADIRAFAVRSADRAASRSPRCMASVAINHWATTPQPLFLGNSPTFSASAFDFSPTPAQSPCAMAICPNPTSPSTLFSASALPAMATSASRVADKLALSMRSGNDASCA